MSPQIPKQCLSASSLCPCKAHCRRYASKPGPRPMPSVTNLHEDPVSNSEFQLPGPTTCCVTKSKLHNLSVPLSRFVKENHSSPFVFISCGFIAERWTQKLQVSITAVGQCCLLTLIFSVELVFCISLFFPFHFSGNLFLSCFTKVAVCCTLEVNTYTTFPHYW